MKKTDLGFYLILDEEYYNLEKPDPEITYVLVNRTDSEFIVLKDGKFMGKINRQLNDMKMAARALDSSENMKEFTSLAELNAFNEKQQTVSAQDFGFVSRTGRVLEF